MGKRYKEFFYGEKEVFYVMNLFDTWVHFFVVCDPGNDVRIQFSKRRHYVKQKQK